MDNRELINKICIHDELQILGFFNQFRFLSNYHICDIEYEGLKYSSSEAAYQAAKSTDNEVRSKFTSLYPPESKKFGYQIELRSDWANVKDGIMDDILKIKFSNEELRALLLSTGSKHLEETNYWNDTYWGVCDGVGENKLGKALMNLRSTLV